MKNFILLLLLSGFFGLISCEKNKDSENFKNLTGTTWRSDSLLVNGIDASGPGGILEDFVGDVRFNEDGTGTFGTYSGKWMFGMNETQLTITSDSLLIPINANIIELTKTSLKIKTSYPNPLDLTTPLNLRLTFKPK
ncbi:MAG TPA: hypothetical protein VHO46_10800 [Bacteroidales bacterium]|nr:hypothetical protein [Bacteroidales bacterium]